MADEPHWTDQILGYDRYNNPFFSGFPLAPGLWFKPDMDYPPIAEAKYDDDDPPDLPPLPSSPITDSDPYEP